MPPSAIKRVQVWVTHRSTQRRYSAVLSNQVVILGVMIFVILRKRDRLRLHANFRCISDPIKHRTGGIKLKLCLRGMSPPISTRHSRSAIHAHTTHTTHTTFPFISCYLLAAIIRACKYRNFTFLQEFALFPLGDAGFD